MGPARIQAAGNRQRGEKFQSSACNFLEGLSMGAIRVVVADDDVLLLKGLATCLRAAGYLVECFDNGSDALDALRAHPPHVAVLDHFMPGLTGREICRRLRGEGTAARLLLLTTARELPDRVAGLDAGADDYLVKPFEVEELLARIRVQLRPPASSTGPRQAELARDLQSREPRRRDQAIRALAERPGGLHFHVLGDFRVRRDGVDVAAALFNRRKPKALLKILLATYDRIVPPDALWDALWADLGVDAARKNLHVCVQRLRLALGPFGAERVETVEGGYAVRLQPDDSLDLREFDRAARAATAAMARGDCSAVDALMDLYTGPLFADDPYADWAEPHRERVRATFTGVLAGAATIHRRRGEHDRACHVLRRLVEMDACDESRAVELAECLEALGDRLSAAAVLARTREILRSQLGIGPGERLRTAHERLVQSG